jgi:predicted oxidoreductase
LDTVIGFGGPPFAWKKFIQTIVRVSVYPAQNILKINIWIYIHRPACLDKTQECGRSFCAVFIPGKKRFFVVLNRSEAKNAESLLLVEKKLFNLLLLKRIKTDYT